MNLAPAFVRQLEPSSIPHFTPSVLLIEEEVPVGASLERSLRDEKSPYERIAAPGPIAVDFRETRRIAGAVLQHAITAGLLLLYSESVMGAAIRAAIRP